MSEIRCEMKQHLGVLSKNERTGWTTEANIVSWNDGPEKLDIRDWSPDHSKSSKGKTLTEAEARALNMILEKMFGGE